MNNNNYGNAFDGIDINDILSQIKVSDITGKDTQSKMPEGYYLGELNDIVLGNSAAGTPMVTVTYKTVENGLDAVVDDSGFATMQEIANTKNRYIKVYYLMNDVQKATKMANDLSKFIGEDKEPLLDKEMFLSQDTLLEIFDVLKEIKPRIYLKVEYYTKKDGTEGSSTNIISWDRAEKLELPL